MAKEGERCEMMSDSSVSNAPFFICIEREFKIPLIFLNNF